MKLRIAIWAGVGALVVVAWTVCTIATRPTPLGVTWVLADLTCPIVLARHYALSIYVVLVVNAATYALVGTIVETMRRHYKTRLISN